MMNILLTTTFQKAHLYQIEKTLYDILVCLKGISTLLLVIIVLLSIHIFIKKNNH